MYSAQVFLLLKKKEHTDGRNESGFTGEAGAVVEAETGVADYTSFKKYMVGGLCVRAFPGGYQADRADDRLEVERN